MNEYAKLRRAGVAWGCTVSACLALFCLLKTVRLERSGATIPAAGRAKPLESLRCPAAAAAALALPMTPISVRSPSPPPPHLPPSAARLPPPLPLRRRLPAARVHHALPPVLAARRVGPGPHDVHDELGGGLDGGCHGHAGPHYPRILGARPELPIPPEHPRGTAALASGRRQSAV